jgi:Zn-dependent metalloprotease
MKRTLLFSLASLCLVSANAQTEQTLIKDYLQKNANLWSLQSEDFNGIEITSTASSKAQGTKHYYIRQSLNGIPVVNGIGTVTLKNNSVFKVNGRFQDLPNQFASQAVLTAETAI